MHLADLLEARVHAEFHKAKRYFAAKHFGLVSPHRGFPTHGQGGVLQVPEGVPHGDALGIHASDANAIAHVGVVRDIHKPADKDAHNVAAWHKMRGELQGAGWRHSHAHGLYKETGVPKATAEGSFVVGGVGRRGQQLAQHHVERMAKDYGQDSYIYAGPETGGKTTLFNAKRDATGITGYHAGDGGGWNGDLGHPEWRKFAGGAKSTQHGIAKGDIIGATQPVKTRRRADVIRAAITGRIGTGHAADFH